jgi:hypothetical protein
MKKITLLIIALLFANITFSQDYSIEELKIVQNLFGVQKKSVYEENMNLTGVNATTFWTLYNEYEVERKKIGEKKMALLMSYTNEDGAVTNDQADELLSQATSIRSSENKLITKYVKKIRKETSSLVAAQFYQIEHYITDGVRFALLDSIDFISDKK